MHLRTIGLYSLTLNKNIESTSSIEKSKYLNRMDKAFRTICSLISLDLLFKYLLVKPPMNPGTPWKGSLENNVR